VGGRKFKGDFKAKLIKFDAGLLARVERERSLSPRSGSGALVPTTQLIRDLMQEGLDARCLARGEEVPAALPATFEDDVEAESTDYRSLARDTLTQQAEVSEVAEAGSGPLEGATVEGAG
jgi:hypothetical protein